MLIRPDSRITVMEGAPNNIPDAAANSAAMEIMKIAEQVKERDILIVLISGQCRLQGLLTVFWHF